MRKAGKPASPAGFLCSSAGFQIWRQISDNCKVFFVIFAGDKSKPNYNELTTIANLPN